MHTIVCTWLRIYWWTRYPKIPKQVFSIISLCNAVFSGRSKMSGSTPKKPVPAPGKGRKPKEPSAWDNCGCCFTTQFWDIKGGWISSKNNYGCFPPLEKVKHHQSCPAFWKTNFSLSWTKEHLSPQEFAWGVEQRFETALWCFHKLELETKKLPSALILEQIPIPAPANSGDHKKRKLWEIITVGNIANDLLKT